VLIQPDGKNLSRRPSILKKVNITAHSNPIKELAATEEKSEVQKTFTAMRNKVNTSELET
jgi:hypothetical protein